MDTLTEVLLSFDEESVRSHAGRNGSPCVGIVCESPTHTIAALAKHIVESCNEETALELLEELQEHATDSAGVDSILYFPHVDSSELDDEEGFDNDESDGDLLSELCFDDDLMSA